MEFFHPAIRHVALGRHAIEFAQTFAILDYTFGFNFDHITAVDMSFFTTVQIFLSKWDRPRQKNDTKQGRKEGILLRILVHVIGRELSYSNSPAITTVKKV